MKQQEFADNIQNISDYAWMHFEGRPNIDEIKKMLEFIHGNCDNSNLNWIVEYHFLDTKFSRFSSLKFNLLSQS